MTYEWSWGANGSCPTSTHRKQWHQGNRTSRRTVTKELPMLGRYNKGKTFTSTTYVDHVVCANCGAEHDQEWMPA